MHKITAGDEILPIFLLYQFFTKSKKGVFDAIVNRVSIAHLTREKLVTVSFCKPPLKEQQVIVSYINQKCTEIHETMSRAEREIELMQEYRTRLISDIVTGQVDVRDIEVPEVLVEELLDLEEDPSEAIDDQLEAGEEE